MGYQIKDIARMNAVSARSIRLFEEYGVISPGRDVNGYRQYTMEDSFQIANFLAYRSLGFNVEDATLLCKTKISMQTLSMISEKMSEIGEQLSDLNLRHRKISIFRDDVEFALNNQDIVVYKNEGKKLFLPVISVDDQELSKEAARDSQEWIKQLPITQHVMYYTMERFSDGCYYPELGLIVEQKDLKDVRLPISDSCREVPESYCLQLYHMSPGNVRALDTSVLDIFENNIVSRHLGRPVCLMAYPLFAAPESKEEKMIYKYLMMISQES